MDCPVCPSGKGLKDRAEIVKHMDLQHAGNVGLLIDKFADYIVAHES